MTWLAPARATSTGCPLPPGRRRLRAPADPGRAVLGRDQDHRWARGDVAVRPAAERLLQCPALARVLDRDEERGVVRRKDRAGALRAGHGAEELHRAAALCAL